MSETNRAMNLDEEATIPVTIGGREFSLTQMSRPKIERILRAAAKALPEAPPPAEGEVAPEQAEDEFLRHAGENWDQQIPTFAMILGYFEPNDDETLGVIAHLTEHLSIPGGFKLYRRWWEFNEIRDFFLRSGHPTLPPDLFDQIKEKTSR